MIIVVNVIGDKYDMVRGYVGERFCARGLWW